MAVYLLAPCEDAARDRGSQASEAGQASDNFATLPDSQLPVAAPEDEGTPQPEGEVAADGVDAT